MADQPGIVVTGAGGQVGLALRERLPGARFLTHTELDVCDAGAVHEALSGARCVVHLAAMTHVDRCEQEPETAWAVNGQGTMHVCQAAGAQGARVIYLSTDYVFAGDRAGEWHEADDTHPVNVYGASKLGGERSVLALHHGLVVRTSWVYGEGRNFLRTILQAAREGRQLRVVDDQVGRPTSARTLAEAIVWLIERPVEGALHVTDDGEPVSWAGLAEFALEQAGIEAEVEGITTAEFGAPAPRPANSTLALGHAKQLGVPLGDWRKRVREYVRAAA
jgi:dTDP-4-dehydrorhamnose 3,5-epimerase